MATDQPPRAQAQKAWTPARGPAPHPQCAALLGARGLPVAAVAQRLWALADGLSLLSELAAPGALGLSPRPAAGAGAPRRGQGRAPHRRHPRQSDGALGRSYWRNGIRCRQKDQGTQTSCAGGHAGVAAGCLRDAGQHARTQRSAPIAGRGAALVWLVALSVVRQWLLRAG